MDIEFDPAKDAGNVAKHGISLERARDLEEAIVITDDRFAEPRYRLYGLIEGVWPCAPVTLRGSAVRVISPRRAHRKEVKRYA